MTSPLILRNARVPELFLGVGDDCGDPDLTSAARVRVEIEAGYIRAVTPERNDATPVRASEVDLGGRWLLPAFCESHAHLVYASIHRRMHRLDSSAGVSEILAGGRPRSDGWVLGAGWDDTGLGESEIATLEERPEPVFLWSSDHHRAIVNAAGRSRLGLAATTPRLVEEAAFSAWSSLPADESTIEAEMQTWLEHGITAVTTFDRRWSIDPLARLAAAGALPLRVGHAVPIDEFLAAEAEGTDSSTSFGLAAPQRVGRLSLGWVKLFFDGTLGSSSAWLFDDYEDRPGWRGETTFDFERRDEVIERLASSGFSVAIHAIGDRAVHEAAQFILDVRAARRDRVEPLADRIEHAELIAPDTLERLERHRICLSVQPCHLYEDWRVAPRRWGAERCASVIPLRTLERRGVPFVLGTDAPVEPVDPWANLHAAVSRRGRDSDGSLGVPWQPQECLEFRSAIRAATFAAAAPNRLPDGWGRVGAGSPADLQILETTRPLHRVTRIEEAVWLATLVEGRVAAGQLPGSNSAVRVAAAEERSTDE